MAATASNIDLAFRPWSEPKVRERPRSLWIEQALAREPIEPEALHNEQRADVCIVGGGFTGLWTAIRLRDLDPALTITIVEADLCGTGASGRNSGALGHWWAKLPTLLRLLGKDDAIRVLRASISVLDDIQDFVRDEGIACDLRHEPSVWSATAKSQIGAWQPMFRAAESVGLKPPHRVLGADEIRLLFGRAPCYAGIMERNAIRLQPALLALGLRRTALARGVRIFERSPVLRIVGASDAISVATAQGAIRAQKVVLAANAWMAHLTEFKSSIMVISSDIVVTDPIPELLLELGMDRRPGGVNSRMMLNYGGYTPDKRVYLGRGGGTIAYDARIGAAFDESPKQAAEVDDDFRYLYPELASVPIARSWSGPIDRSTTGLPWFGQVEGDPRLHYAIGYTGHGVAATAIGGRVLASAVLGRTDEWTELGACLLRARRGVFPPEPIRYFGGHIVRGAVARKERADRDGRIASRIDQALSRLAPATFNTTANRERTEINSLCR